MNGLDHTLPLVSKAFTLLNRAPGFLDWFDQPHLYIIRNHTDK